MSGHLLYGTGKDAGADIPHNNEGFVSGAADSGGGQRIHNNRGWIQCVVLRRIRLEKRQEVAQRLTHAPAGGRAAGTVVGTGIAICISGGSVGVMMMVMAATNGLSQIMDIRELVALRGAIEVAGKLAQLSRRRGIAVGLGRLSGVLQIGGDLLRDLLVPGWIGLLKLLKHAHHLGKR